MFLAQVSASAPPAVSRKKNAPHFREVRFFAFASANVCFTCRYLVVYLCFFACFRLFSPVCGLDLGLDLGLGLGLGLLILIYTYTYLYLFMFILLHLKADAAYSLS